MPTASQAANAAARKWATQTSGKGSWVAPPQGGVPAAVAARAWYWACVWAAAPPSYAPPVVGAGTATTPQMEVIGGKTYVFRWLPTLQRSGPLVPQNLPANWPPVQIIVWQARIGVTLPPPGLHGGGHWHSRPHVGP